MATFQKTWNFRFIVKMGSKAMIFNRVVDNRHFSDDITKSQKRHLCNLIVLVAIFGAYNSLFVCCTSSLNFISIKKGHVLKYVKISKKKNLCKSASL